MIRWLPAFHPCQLVFSSAFTTRANATAALGALAWAVATLALLAAAVQWRMRGPLGSGGRFEP